MTLRRQAIAVHIENICPDFFRFWAQAETAAHDEQKEIWSGLYEACHAEVFNVYYSLYGAREGLDDALDRFGQHITRLRALEPVVAESIARIVPKCQSLFLPPENDLRFVMMVGLFYSDAWAAFLRGQPASFVALEQIRDTMNVDVTIAHEAAHTLHRQCTGFVADVTTHTVGQTLFTEGLAILASSKVVPDAGLVELFLVEEESWIHACKQHWTELRKGLLRDMERLAWIKPTPYFYNDPMLLTSEVPVPRAGYFAGYQVVRVLGESYPIEVMGRWSIDTATAQVRAVLEQMSEYLDNNTLR